MQNKSLIERDNWVLDEASSKCADCGKPFILIIRRRHHCRFCGSLFCDDCSNYYIDGLFFQFQNKPEKHVRFCKGCFQEVTTKLGEQGSLKEQKNKGTFFISRLNKNNLKQEAENKKSLNGSKQSVLESEKNTQDNQEDQKSKLNANYDILFGQQVDAQKLENRDQSPKFSKKTLQDVTEEITQLDFDDDDNATLGLVDNQIEQDDFKVQIEEIKQNLINLQDEMSQKINAIIQVFIEKNKIKPYWTKIINNYVTRAIKDIIIDNQNQFHTMDINRYIKIKKIPYVTMEATDYIKGIVCRKNVAHKKMKTYIDKPKILVFYGSLENYSDDSAISFQELAKNETKQHKGLIDKIAKLGPNIIFVEKNVNIIALQELQKRDITVAQQMKQQVLQHICITTGARPIKKLADIDRYEKQPNKALGIGEKLIFKSYDPNLVVLDKKIFESLSQENMHQIQQYIEKKKNKDPTILFLRAKETSTCSCVTITLSGPYLQDLSVLKQMMRQILRFAYHLNLEKEMISVDLRFQRKMNQTFQNQINQESMLTCGSITEFIYKKVQNEDEIIKKDYLDFVKVRFVEFGEYNRKNIPDVDNNAELNSYIRENFERFNKKIGFFTDICQLAQRRTVQFYKKYDVPLGRYIQQKIHKSSTECESCKTNHQHVVIIYGPQIYVKITVEKQLQGKNLRILFRKDYQNSIMPSNIALSFDMDQATLSESSDLPEKIQINQVVIEKKSSNDQDKNKRRMVIDTYLECDVCNEKLTEQLRLKKMHLEYSTFRFVQHIMLTAQEQFSKQPELRMLKNKFPQVDGYQCKHEHVSRVFQTQDDAKVKFYCNLFQVYDVTFFNILNADVQANVEKNIQETLESRKQELIASIEEIRDVLYHYVKKQICRGIQKDDPDLTPEDQKKLKAKKLLCRKLDELVKRSLKVISQGKFKDFLHLENRSMQYNVQFEQFSHLVRAVAKTFEDPQKEKLPGTDGMLVLLINPKTMVDPRAKTRKPQRSETKAIPSIKNSKQQLQMKQSQQVLPNQQRGSKLGEAALGINNRTSATNQIGMVKEIDVFHLNISVEINAPANNSPIDTNKATDIKSIEKLNINKSETIFFSTEETTYNTTPITDEQSPQVQLLNDQTQQNETQQKVEQAEQQQQQTQSQAKQSHQKKEYKLDKLWPRHADNYNEPKNNSVIYPFIPLLENDEMCLLAYALNSGQYYQNVYDKNGFPKFEKMIFPGTEQTQKQFIENIFKGGKKEDQSFHLKVVAESQKVNYKESELQLILAQDNPQEEQPTASQIGESQTENQQQGVNLQNQSSEKPTIKTLDDIPVKKSTKFSTEVILFYPTEFEALRMMNNISLEQFIRSVASCCSWQSEGGKSQSAFYKSADQLFIFKAVKESEFDYMKQFAPKYFDFMFQLSYKQKPSVLGKIFCMVELKLSKGSVHFIAMENLFYGMSGELQVYDLKGSEKNRWSRKSDAKVFLDTNYRIDRNGEPLAISAPIYKNIMQALMDDSDFLEEICVIDYSLLLIIDQAQLQVRMGIIDYLQYFDGRKKIESHAKRIYNLGQDPTIIKAEYYRDRFQKFMKKYFMEGRTSF